VIRPFGSAGLANQKDRIQQVLRDITKERAT
jgi:hypothetical protein